MTGDLATEGQKVKAENDAEARRAERSRLLDEEMKANGGHYSRAFEKLSRKHPALF